MQYHVVQTRASGDLPGHISRLAHWNSDEEDRGYWIKNPDTNKYVHIKFLTYEYIKKEDQTRHTGHSWFLLKQDTADPTNLNWYTTLSEQIENDNFFQLGHWKETDPQFQSGRHMMYPPANPTPQPLEIAATPHIEMEEVAATVTAPVPPTETKLANDNRALSGVPPPIFNGDREKSEHFLDTFMSYGDCQWRCLTVHHPLSKSGTLPLIPQWTQGRRLGQAATLVAKEPLQARWHPDD